MQGIKTQYFFVLLAFFVRLWYLLIGRESFRVNYSFTKKLSYNTKKEIYDVFKYGVHKLIILYICNISKYIINNLNIINISIFNRLFSFVFDILLCFLHTMQYIYIYI